MSNGSERYGLAEDPNGRRRACFFLYVQREGPPTARKYGVL